MSHRDLREWIAQARELGELRQVNGADWDLEMSAAAEILGRDKTRVRQALLFDEVPGFPAGYRVLLEALVTTPKVALTLGLDPAIERTALVDTLRRKLNALSPIPPKLVDRGPVLQNIREGKEVDLFAFPAPKYHANDGGRYIGTGSVTITRDPSDGWVNLGTYRIMLHDERTLSFHVSPSHHGRIHRDVYFERGEPMQVAISFGHDPLLLLAGSAGVRYGLSEYDWAGGLRGEAIEVVAGPHTGLPVPATAEIVVEGTSTPGDDLPEGPYGEWHGYYTGSARQTPTVRVSSLMFRDDPIILGVPLLRPSAAPLVFDSILREAMALDQLEKAGVQGVRAVHFHEAAAGTMLTIISIQQRFGGHSRQAARVLAQCSAGSYMGRYTIVVDDDIDVYDTDEVLWAVATRSDPATALEILTHCVSGPLDPAIRPGPNGEKFFNSRAIIDACRPWDWRSQFPVPHTTPADVLTRVMERFGSQLYDRRDGLEGRPSAIPAGALRR